MKKWLSKLYIRFFLKKHKFPPASLIHRKNRVLFEIEFNWYDESFQPVSIVREIKSGKIFSIRFDEMLEFREYSGDDPNAGSTI